jgi:hypothetical protein
MRRASTIMMGNFRRADNHLRRSPRPGPIAVRIPSPPPCWRATVRRRSKRVFLFLQAAFPSGWSRAACAGIKAPGGNTSHAPGDYPSVCLSVCLCNSADRTAAVGPNASAICLTLVCRPTRAPVSLSDDFSVICVAWLFVEADDVIPSPGPGGGCRPPKTSREFVDLWNDTNELAPTEPKASLLRMH